MVDLNELSRRWNADYDRYDRFTKDLVADVDERLRQAGVKPMKLSGRPKDRGTFVTKVIRKGYNTYEEVTDKSGVRVVLRMEREVDQVVDILSSAYRCEIEDKRTTADVGVFGYRAVHLQALEPLAVHSGLDSEIQVRTICSDAWSEMAHFLAYKSPVAIPAHVERTQRALAGLFELADAEYARHFHVVNALPERRGAALLELIQPLRLKLAGAPWDQELSVVMLTALMPAYGAADAEEIADVVANWVAERNDELIALLSEANADPGSVTALVLQPEALVIGERLSARATEVVGLWDSVAPHAALESVAFALGLSLD